MAWPSVRTSHNHKHTDNHLTLFKDENNTTIMIINITITVITIITIISRLIILIEI